MSLPSRLLGANPSIQVSTLLSGSLTTPSAKSAFIPPTAFESIATVTVGAGGAVTVEFTSIPATYSHLQVRFIARSGQSPASMRMTFNSDSGSNYSYHELNGDGSTAAASTAAPLQFIYTGQYFNTTNHFGAGVVDILDYSSTNKAKTARILSGREDNGSGRIFLHSGAWYNSSTAVTSITFTREPGNNFAQYTTFALYGIKGA